MSALSWAALRTTSDIKRRGPSSSGNLETYDTKAGSPEYGSSGVFLRTEGSVADGLARAGLLQSPVECVYSGKSGDKADVRGWTTRYASDQLSGRVFSSLDAPQEKNAGSSQRYRWEALFRPRLRPTQQTETEKASYDKLSSLMRSADKLQVEFEQDIVQSTFRDMTSEAAAATKSGPSTSRVFRLGDMYPSAPELIGQSWVIKTAGRWVDQCSGNSAEEQLVVTLRLILSEDERDDRETQGEGSTRVDPAPNAPSLRRVHTWPADQSDTQPCTSPKSARGSLASGIVRMLLPTIEE